MGKIFIPYSEVENPPFSDTPLGQLVNGARSAACAIYNGWPTFAIADPTGLGSLHQAIWDKICPSGGGGPPPLIPIAPPIAGGRCECIEYQIVVARRSQGVEQSNIIFNVPGPVTVRGWVGGAIAPLLDYRIEYGAPDCGGLQFTNVFANVLREDVRSDYTWAEILSITRVDGQADNCGSQPPIYPPQEPPAPILNPVIPITFAPGFTIPVGFVYVKPSLNIDVDGKIGININPSFNIDLAPDVNINIGLSFGGVNINFAPKQRPGQPPSLPPSPAPDPRNPPPKLPPGIREEEDCCDELSEKLRDIIERLKALEECACPSFDSLAPVRIITGNSGIANLPEKTRWVRVFISSLPPNAKSWNGNSAPSPVTAGWGWFSYSAAGESMGQRFPLDAFDKAYPVPRGAKRFGYTIYTGGSGFADAMVQL